VTFAVKLAFVNGFMKSPFFSKVRFKFP